MASTTYDELLKQVESLRAENSHLKRELQDNSSHLSKLEGESATMKDVLTHLHSSTMEEDSESNLIDITSVYPEYQTPPRMTLDKDDNHLDLDQNSNSSNDETTTEQNWAHLQTNNPFRASNPQLNLTSGGQGQEEEDGKKAEAEGHSPSSPPSGSPSKRHRSANNQEMYSLLHEMDQERSSLLHEIEAEDKHCKWYYEQIEAVNEKLNNLPVSDSYNLQVDMTRRQLEMELRRLRELLQENLGSSEQIARRHDARLQRIHVIETEMLQIQQRHHRQLEAEKRDSGTCDHLEHDEDGVIVTDAATNTTVSGDAFVCNPLGELDVHSQKERGILVNGPNGTKLQTIATQTAEVCLQDDGAGLTNQNLTSLYHGGWPLSGGVACGEGSGSLAAVLASQDTASVMSFHSSNVTSSSQASGPGSAHRAAHHHLGTKVEMVYSLLSMLGTHDKDDMSRTLLAMSSSQDSCIAMRQSGCLPLLIQLLHGSDKDSGLLGNTRGSKAARARAAAALHNIVHSHPDDKRGRREARVLRLLEQIRAHCDQLRSLMQEEEEEEGNRSRPGSGSADIDHHPGPAIAALMKLSFDEEHRHAICTLGGLQAIAELLQFDHSINGSTTEQYNITMRRYACMALTNLTFGDGTNKALLCSMKPCMSALVAQLQSPNEDLRQVAASVLRNLSWRADLASKKTLREVNSVTALTLAAMEVKKESTLKSILSALWNLSAHCSENKADICAVEGSLSFLVGILSYKSPSKTLAIIENGGGILRNVSSHIAVREDYRKVLRVNGCLPLLLKHLRSPSLTIVSNACGTLWNLSARCPEDQKALWDMGAVNMLRNLVHSKHKMISMGSAAALKNLLSARPALNTLEDNVFSKSNMPGLHVRKARALKEELDSQHLSETCENLESPQGSPTETRKFNNAKNKFLYNGDNNGVYQAGLMRGQFMQRGMSDVTPQTRVESPHRSVSRSGSQDSVGSTHSDISHDRIRMQNMLSRSKILQERSAGGYRNNINGDTSPPDHNGRSSGPNSRIIQAMQEVARHAGLDADGCLKGPFPESHSADSTPASVRRLQGQDRNRGPQRGATGIPTFRAPQPQQAAYKNNAEMLNNAVAKEHKHNMNFSHLSQRMESLHLNLPEPEQDEPINYSIKYSESQPSASIVSSSAMSTQAQSLLSSSSSSQQRPNNQVTPSQTSAFVKPIPKVHNYVGGMRYSSETAPKSASQPTKTTNLKSNTNKLAESSQQQYSGPYAITDLDNDQPTNYGMRYAEEDDDVHDSDDQPINYSTRFSEQEEHSDRVRDYSEIHGLNDDSVRNYCTEGTPLNFMSTATSMNDLTNKPVHQKPETKVITSQASQVTQQQKSQQQSQQQKPGYQADILNLSMKASNDSEMMSSAGSQSTDRNTGSTVISKKAGDLQNIQNNNIPTSKGSPQSTGEKSAASSHPPSMYSYNDNSTNTSSPSERTRQYCTEGTPTCFSRVSSLSSLHSNDAQDHTSNSSPLNSSSGHKHDHVLQSIDENDSLNLTNNDVTLKPGNESFQSSANTTLNTTGGGNTGGHVKTVTFDDHNQVQETPMMFSRCSSLGSLSSFDAHSIHSSVVSEYSRRESEVVSPSDLPASPSDTMPSSPTHKSPVKFGPEPPRISKNLQQEMTPSPQPQRHIMQAPKPKQPVSEPQKLFEDSPQHYAQEDSPPGNFSSATSLSALTIDDEPRIRKEPELRRIPLVQEEDLHESNSGGNSNDHTMNDTVNTVKTVIEKVPQKEEIEIINVNDDDDDDFSLSDGEGEEDILAQCISIAMPTKSSKPIKKSSSDGYLKDKAESPRYPPANTSRSSKLPTRIPTSQSLGAMSGHQYQHRPSTRPVVEETTGGYDTPLRFATEGTPLNFSNTGSLSDLSLDSHKAGDGASVADKSDLPLVQQALEAEDKAEDVRGHDDDDDGSDLSSLSGGDEDLLSEAIAAAMPKSKKPWKPPQDVDRRAEGSDAKQAQRYQSPAFKKPIPVAQPVSRPSTTQQRAPPVQQSRPQQQPIHTDSVTTYAVEGTPVNYSRRTSLSDLSVDSADGEAVHEEEAGKSEEKTAPHHIASKPFVPAYHDQGYVPPLSASDSPKVFGMEGTPVSFSRNDSLSSLSCDEEDQTAELPKGPEKGHFKTKLFSPKKPEQPAVARLKTPSKAQKLMHGPSCTSTPMAKNMYGPAPMPRHSEDQVKSFAVEGTPDCFSRNSSLSSLESGDDSNHNESQLPPRPEEGGMDRNAAYKVEDTPAVFSRNSSLSSLSVESLSFDPTPSEAALLEECINSAMPKSKKKEKKAESTKRASPGGADAQTKAPTKQERPDDAKRKNEDDTTEQHSQQPKNGEGPQAETDGEKISLDDDGIEVDHPDGDMMLKDQKEASNQETLAHKSDSMTEEAQGSEEPPMAEGQDLMASDNKMAEEMQELEDKMSEFGLSGSEAFEKELCLEAKICAEAIQNEKLDISDDEEDEEIEQQAYKKAESAESLTMGCRPLDTMTGSDLSADIMKESFPEMSSSLVSSLTTPDEENLPLDVSQTVRNNRTLVGEEAVEDNTMQAETSEDSLPVDDEEVPEEEISLDDERLLEENANIILSELSLKRELSSSTLDEDLFIEHETISLVSDAYASDTASEVSECQSVSSRTASEHNSEASTSTLSHTSSAHSLAPKGPRIVKPINRETVRQQTQHDKGPKPIRGRRKALSAPRVPAAASKQTSPAQSKGAKPIAPKRTTSLGPKPVTPVKPQISAKPSPPTSKFGSSPGAKKTPPRPTQAKSVTPVRGTAAQKGLPGRTSSSSSPRGSSTSISSLAQKSASTTKTTPKSAGAKDKTPGKATSKTSDKSVERPAPPIKQGTFTMDQPSQNVPLITSDDKIEQEEHHSNRNSLATTPPGSSRNSAEASNIPKPSPSKRGSQSDIPTPGGKRASSGSLKKPEASPSPQNTWSKNLETYKFLMDSPNEEEAKEAVSSKKAADSDIPKAKKEDEPKVSKLKSPATGGSATGAKPVSRLGMAKTASGSSLSKMGSPMGKTASGASLNKSGSGASLHKTGSTSSIKSGGSGTTKTPPKPALPPRNTSRNSPTGASKVTPPRANIHKSESQSSLKKGASPVKPGIPSRKSSVSSASSAQTVKENPLVKKATVVSAPAPATAGKKQAVSKIASLWRKEKKATEDDEVFEAAEVPKKAPSKIGKPAAKPASQEKSEKRPPPITRSGTYDKLLPETDKVAVVVMEAGEDRVQPQDTQAVTASGEKVPPPLPPRNTMWRRTYTIPGDEDSAGVSAATEAEDTAKAEAKPSKPAKKSLSLFKRSHHSDSDKPKDKDKTKDKKKEKKEKQTEVVQEQVREKPEPPPKKKGFSLWRRDAKGSKIPGNKDSAKSVKDSVANSKSMESVAVNYVEAVDPLVNKSATLPAKAMNRGPGEVKTLGSPVFSSNTSSPLSSPTRTVPPANAAIVPPFNYKPSTAKSVDTVDDDAEDKAPSPLGSPALKHVTKTEMLMARRRKSYMNSVKSEGEGDVDSSDGEVKKPAPLVTTV